MSGIAGLKCKCMFVFIRNCQLFSGKDYMLRTKGKMGDTVMNINNWEGEQGLKHMLAFT